MYALYYQWRVKIQKQCDFPLSKQNVFIIEILEIRL